MKKKIKICSNHQEKEKTPLIYTFAFIGAEYWCPYCGYIGGVLGSGENIKWTQKLQDRYDKYKKESKAFLKSKGVLICSSMKIKGVYRKFKDLPPQTQSYYKNKAKSWKYKI